MKPEFILMLTNKDTTVIVARACFLESKGVQDMDLSSYRYLGDALQLLQEEVKATTVPIVSAGSVESYERLAGPRRAGAGDSRLAAHCLTKRNQRTFKSVSCILHHNK